jgi:predicted MFS family arabinose efflux permease
VIDRRAFILSAGMFAVGTDAFVVAGILPETAQSLSVSIERAGLVVSVFSVAYAVGSPLLVALSEGWRRSLVLGGSLLIFALANALSAISPTLLLLLATRVLAGLSAGLFAPAALASGSTLGAAESRGRTMAIVVAGYTSSLILGVPLGVAIGQYLGWRGALAFVAVVAAAGAGALYLAGLPEVAAAASQRRFLERLKPTFRLRVFAVLLPFMIWSIAHYGLYTFLAPILEQHLPRGVLPPLLFVFGLGAVAGNLIGGSQHDSHGPSRPTIICLLLLAGLLAMIGFTSTSLLLAGVNLVCWAICIAALYVLQQQRAISLEAEHSNLLLALNNSAMYAGASIGAAAAGSVISAFSLSALPWASAGTAAIGAVSLLLLRTPRTKAAASSSHGETYAD